MMTPKIDPSITPITIIATSLPICSPTVLVRWHSPTPRPQAHGPRPLAVGAADRPRLRAPLPVWPSRQRALLPLATLALKQANHSDNRPKHDHDNVTKIHVPTKTQPATSSLELTHPLAPPDTRQLRMASRSQEQATDPHPHSPDVFTQDGPRSFHPRWSNGFSPKVVQRVVIQGGPG